MKKVECFYNRLEDHRMGCLRKNNPRNFYNIFKQRVTLLCVQMTFFYHFKNVLSVDNDADAKFDKNSLRIFEELDDTISEKRNC